MSYKCQIAVNFVFNPTERKYRGLLRNELVEIGAVKLNDRLEEVDRFSCFVKPEYNDRIEPNVTALTGIRYEDVQEAMYFEEAIALFSAWIGDAECRVLGWNDSAFVQLEDECWAKDMPFPAKLTYWETLRPAWQQIMHYPVRYRISISQAAALSGIPYDESKANSAVYDAYVTSEMLKKLRSNEYMGSAA